jgi:hypothetical protein
MLIVGSATVPDLQLDRTDDAAQGHGLLAPVPGLSGREGENSALAVGFFLELLLQSAARPFAPFF